MATRGDRADTQQKYKVHLLTGSRDRRHGISVRATGKTSRVVQRQKTSERGEWRPWPYWDFCVQCKTGQGEQVEIS